MKIFKSLAIVGISTLVFAACKKTDTQQDPTELSTTTELSANEAVSESLVSDDNEILFSAAADGNVLGAKDPNNTDNILFGCATVTVTPASGFPKNILVDFGTGCTFNGITRSGKILITITDSLRRPGSQSTMTFNNYYVDSFRREGTITWTNTSTATVKSWQRVVVDGKITAPNGRYWVHNSTKNVTQIEGAATPVIRADDVFSVTGNGSTSNSAGLTRTHTILTAVEKAFLCPWPRKGIVKIQGPNHYVILNYGDSGCDRNATISIDGGTPTPILLH